jgi:2-dehydro-3-deoxyphosphogluconate aldolase/(4S)-4-hydroxy-2-oxoglutarate aldolase
MLTKFDSLLNIKSTGTFLIIRLDNEEVAYQVAKASIAGGMRALEITYSVPGALRIVRRLAEEHSADGVLIGVGTVIDSESAHSAIEAGARMLVSPHLCTEMIKIANRYQAVSICGAFTPSEMLGAIEAGADIAKLFPAEVVSPAYVKAITAPFPQIPIAPTGGVSPDNVRSWFDAGIFACGVGSYISKAGGKDNDYAKVTEATRTFLRAVSAARS